jgi:hypothetical protein
VASGVSSRLDDRGGVAEPWVVSPEARLPAAALRPRSLWRDAAIGALIALLPAMVAAEVDQAAYRSGAAGMAFLVVIGLSMRWSVALGAAPMLTAAIAAQASDWYRE